MTLGKLLDIIKDNKIHCSTHTSNGFFSRFQSDFRFQSFLGRGGFGVVVKAQNKLDDCSYALKRMELPEDEVSRIRVLREVQTMAKLEHHNIVRYYQSWIEMPPPGWQEQEDEKMLKDLDDDNLYEDYEDDSEISTEDDAVMEQEKLYLYIQMQLCRKDSLKDWLRDNGRDQRFDYIGSIFDQIVDAVHYIHSKSLIHRDLKPGNIFFSQEGLIKIGDFGLVTHKAKKSTMVTYSGDQPQGTDLYMSPELLDGLKYDFKVDIYSLGIILFELLVYFDTEMERYKILTSLRNGDFPAEFIVQHPKEYQLLKKMLSVNPTERPAVGQIKASAPKRIDNQRCLICAPIHNLSNCKEFLSMKVFQRHKVVRQQDYCTKCLVRFHKASQCTSADRCQHCGRKHHTLLHLSAYQMASRQKRPNLQRSKSNIGKHQKLKN